MSEEVTLAQIITYMLPGSEKGKYCEGVVLEAHPPADLVPVKTLNWSVESAPASLPRCWVQPDITGPTRDACVTFEGGSLVASSGRTLTYSNLDVCLYMAKEKSGMGVPSFRSGETLRCKSDVEISADPQGSASPFLSSQVPNPSKAIFTCLPTGRSRALTFRGSFAPTHQRAGSRPDEGFYKVQGGPGTRETSYALVDTTEP